jgi:hypothetical protein
VKFVQNHHHCFRLCRLEARPISPEEAAAAEHWRADGQIKGFLSHQHVPAKSPNECYFDRASPDDSSRRSLSVSQSHEDSLDAFQDVVFPKLWGFAGIVIGPLNERPPLEKAEVDVAGLVMRPAVAVRRTGCINLTSSTLIVRRAARNRQARSSTRRH